MNIVNVPSVRKPSKLDKARARFWETPEPMNRAQYLEQRDLKREIDTMEKEFYMSVHKPGYAKIMNLRGATREELE